MTDYYAKVRQAIRTCCQYAKERYGFEQAVDIEFRNMGRIGGKAVKTYKGWREYEYSIIINTQLLRESDIDEICNEVVPHEVAHLVCFWNPTLGRNHDRGWKRVCIMLGGNGNRCHQYDLKKARRTRKAVYNIYGQETNIGLTVHKRIQAGGSYSIKKGGQRVRICPTQFTGEVKLVA